MERKKLITAAEVAEELGVSQAFAYKVIKGMNEELKSRGFLIISGKVSRKYFEEKYYGFNEVM
ncbi:MAG: HTH domain-containing protein [Bacillota bacterium]